MKKEAGKVIEMGELSTNIVSSFIRVFSLNTVNKILPEDFIPLLNQPTFLNER